jgi:hypothetical protein
MLNEEGSPNAEIPSEPNSSKIAPNQKSNPELLQKLIEYMVEERKGEPCSYQVISSKFMDYNKKELQATVLELLNETPKMLVKKELQRNICVYFVDRRYYSQRIFPNSTFDKSKLRGLCSTLSNVHN